MASAYFQPTLYALKNTFLRKLGRNVDINEDTHDVQIIAPSEQFHYRQSHFLEGEVDKITKAAFGNTSRINNIYAGPVQLDAVRCITVKDAYLTPNYVYARSGQKIFHPQLKNSLQSPTQCVKQAALASSFQGSYYFGHWVRDDCATYLLAQEHGPVCTMASPNWSDKAHYARLFEQDWTPSHPLHCEQLTLFFNIGHTPHKTARFRQLRDKLRSQNSTRATSRLVYIKRGASASSRALLNEDALIDRLQQLGVHIHLAETNTEHLTANFLDTDIVISVEGSQLSHALYLLRDGGGLLVIQPPDRFSTAHLDWAQLMGMEFGFVVADASEGGFTVNLDDLERTLEMVQTAINS